MVDQQVAKVLEETKKNALRRKTEISTEIRNPFIVSVTEDFVKEYQDVVDSLRMELATYYDPCATANQAPLPLPPPIVLPGMLPPPPPTSGVDCSDVAQKRLEELHVYHDEQMTEVDQLTDYQNTAMDDHPTWYENIASALNEFTYQILCAIETYTEQLGESPYGEGPEEEVVLLLHKFRAAED